MSKKLKYEGKIVQIYTPVYKEVYRIKVTKVINENELHGKILDTDIEVIHHLNSRIKVEVINLS